MPIHKVKQGEHLASIASAYGFENFETIWNDSQNAQLRQSRASPLMLLPDDEVWIPELPPARFTLATGKKHKLTVHTGKLQLRLRVLDLRGEPIPDAPCVLKVGHYSEELTTDGDGYVQASVDKTATSGTLEVGDLVFDLAIGGLDPLPEPTGLAGRLSNLGYPADDPRYLNPDTMEWTRFALELFQHENGLDVTGALDSGIAEQLATEHGS
ncbi:hypothetical protein [Hyalangium minutum]|uniref:LysM domain-containing protein n=1 Tax=Hyalangium minutum TaxID=394096 RepID=A0A085WW01_9BACT|nr:hypothetical protein [Hyalangium minutum]KFE71864.1 hypothetical protein DB31_0125 [Hyalangium minutum]